MTNFQRLCIVALCSTGIGIGLLRFSYTALMPLTIAEHWWSSDFASYLASANLIGYLLGAIVAFTAIREHLIARVIIFSALLGSLSLVFCGIHPLHEAWYMFWRVISGVTGGLLMVLGPSFALKQVLPEQKNLLGLLAFSGIGFGILISTTLLPPLARFSVAIAWYALGALALVMTLILTLMLRQLPKVELAHLAHASLPQINLTRQQYSLAALVIAAYFMSAIAYIPHSLFWVDFLIRQLHQSQDFANLQWMIYGSGSMIGALVAYFSVKKWGSMNSLWRLYLAFSIAIFLPTFFSHPYILTISSFFCGVLNPATVSLSSTLLADIVTTQRHRQAWGAAVMAFAIAQLIGGLGMSYLLVNRVEYQQLFGIGGSVMLLGVVLSLVAAITQARKTQAVLAP
ncbi:putative MFS family arabinose efflux permease [Acinetobacter calcoaceticus]|uniref:Putative MFS family arabinose efflux permease n=1 Tax=Acinetobacter calcoaceticus TaxID=471 RepID=A0A4V2QZ37_ACICA|nr:putative MFS family arabinose efflux permease [Acinetobacter calcoaceticus]